LIHKLESGWFQTLTLEYQSWFQNVNVPFKFNPRRYEEEAIRDFVYGEFGGGCTS
jgi:hypothetical protein